MNGIHRTYDAILANTSIPPEVGIQPAAQRQ